MNGDGGASGMSENCSLPADVLVRRFHQILLWPLQLMPLKSEGGIRNHWELLAVQSHGIWAELDDEFTDDPRQFAERYYREFVSFLPHVQRFLYGERASRNGNSGIGESPIRIFRRHDIAAVRITLARQPEPLTLQLAHTDLYFFYDVDVVILALEVKGHDLPLSLVQEVMLRFGRAYPAGWGEDGLPLNCFDKVEWLDAAGTVLSTSDYQHREKFLASVCQHQQTTIAAHWEFVLLPMRLDQHGGGTGLSYRQLEYYRMPLMAYIALDGPEQLTRADHVRLAFAGAPGEGLPLSASYLEDFEKRYCYDRFYEPGRPGWTSTRLLCCGHTFVAIGDARKSLFTDDERGFLGMFRHQLFLLGLIAHFHRAALLMYSDRLVTTMSRLDVEVPETVRRFRRDIRLTLEVFLRFTHRYFFSDVSDQALGRDLFRMWSGHLGTAKLYAELREEIQDMSSYLESDMLRRQAVTILQLTVVTLLSLIGTLTTGFLGMNLFNHADYGWFDKLLIYAAVAVPMTGLILYAVVKSQRLSVFLNALADEKLGWRAKLATLWDVWR